MIDEYEFIKKKKARAMHGATSHERAATRHAATQFF
jgi:hypothetical protein